MTEQTPTTTVVKAKGFSWTEFLMGVIITIATITGLQYCGNGLMSNKQQAAAIKALADTLITYKNKDSSNTARISTLLAYNFHTYNSYMDLKKDWEDMATTLEIYKKKLKGAASIVTGTTVTTIPDIGGVPVTLNRDSLTRYIIDSVTGVLKAAPCPTPTYSFADSTKWLAYTVIANSKKVTLNLSMTNDYRVVIGKDKKNYFAEVTNLNPYSKTVALKSYQVTVPKQSRWGLGASGGVTLDYKLKPRPYLGLGLNYTFLNF